MVKGKMKKGLKITLIILGIILVLIIAALLILPKKHAKAMYESNFGFRYDTSEPFRRDLAEFEGLQREKHVFTSNEGQEITGYVYKKGDTEPKGLIVLAHGFGGGHMAYMSIADCFASEGYEVFAYDATGNDESGGNAVNGLPQGVIDLDYALNYIKADEELSDLPLMLWGHSWGGYSACSVAKFHPEIEGIISVSGFNSSLDTIEEVGRIMAGDAIDLFMPVFRKLEKEKFGEPAEWTAIDSLEQTDARVLMYHSKNDETISPEISYDKYYEKFGENDRFEFVLYEDRGHDGIFITDNARNYRDEVEEQVSEKIKDVGYEEMTEEFFNEVYRGIVDKKKYFELDMEVIEQMLEFYDNCIQ